MEFISLLDKLVVQLTFIDCAAARRLDVSGIRYMARVGCGREGGEAGGGGAVVVVAVARKRMKDERGNRIVPRVK